MEEHDSFMKSNPMRGGEVSPLGSKQPPKPRKLPSTPKPKAALSLDEVEESVLKGRSTPNVVPTPKSRKGYIRGASQEDVGGTVTSASQESAHTAIQADGDIELAVPVGEATDAQASQSPNSRSQQTPPSSKRMSKRAASKAGEKLGRAQTDRQSESKASRFKGKFPLQYALWAHYMAIGAALLCIALGVFSMVWTDAKTYKCKIDGELVSDIYLLNSMGTCNATYTHNGKVKYICCNPDSESDLHGYLWIGLIYTLYGLGVLAYENTNWGYGLWYPNDSFAFRNRVSFAAISHFLVGAAGLYNYATCLGGACLISVSVVCQVAVQRREAGDGGREARQAAAKKENASKSAESRSWGKFCQTCCSFQLRTYCHQLFNQDKCATYFWITVYIACNIAVFAWAFSSWELIVQDTNQQLLDGTLDIQCTTRVCHYNRKAVRYGPFSHFAPWAKGFGTTLNLQCTLLLIPVVKNIIRKLNNWGVSFHSSQQANDWCARVFAHPLTRYVPLQKNIEFHMMCAWSIFVFAWAHLFFHLLNLYESNNATLAYFRIWQWDGTYLFSGAVITWAMLMLYSAAMEEVRRAKFEVFFRTHQCMFVVFFAAMFHHGPNFFYWSVAPVLLYLYEKYLASKRGDRPWVVIRAEWIAPVIALYFRPVCKEDFVFKEGQYLYLNCPFISETEWHPFTISSAVDDLQCNTTRIHLETGEEVVEVPRPKNLPSHVKWQKYCLASQDWQTMDANEYLDKADTGYFDYVSLHIKVFGLEDPVARTWTRRLKEYFELMSPGKKFPFYFYRRDGRGEIAMGRQAAPDGQLPVIRVDGPHAAPAEHYVHYGTCMLVGAGIGLTPCVSILTALTKYRWRKNFPPELLHFYWIVRHNEVDSFQWLIHALTDLSFELKRARHSGQIDRRYYCEVNIYITGVPGEKGGGGGGDSLEKGLARAAKKKFGGNTSVSPTFYAEELYARMQRPTVDSRGQVKKMKDAVGTGGLAENRLQDIWVWKGRPYWDEIFREMKDQRQHRDIGVCFCGSPAIGLDLREMCEKHSSVEEDCLFSLHKENF